MTPIGPIGTHQLEHQCLGREAAPGTGLAKNFLAAFDLPLGAVAPMGGWAPDSSGGISDGRIQELIDPEIRRKK
jgi:hypothetical protein